MNKQMIALAKESMLDFVPNEHINWVEVANTITCLEKLAETSNLILDDLMTTTDRSFKPVKTNKLHQELIKDLLQLERVSFKGGEQK